MKRLTEGSRSRSLRSARQVTVVLRHAVARWAFREHLYNQQRSQDWRVRAAA